ncbi:hypothetical protein [Enterococcus sp. AZ103]|uniref:hypothetical protein n=1 Tax=Enterococcus sp. AZ103 TaxID=2774628 RepID=UPI003F275147
MKHIHWLRTAALSLFAFSLYTCFILYIENYEFKYLIITLIFFSIGLILLFIFFCLWVYFSFKVKDSKIRELSEKNKLSKANINGLNESLDEYRKENKNLLEENERILQDFDKLNFVFKTILMNSDDQTIKKAEKVYEFEGKITNDTKEETRK